MAVSVSTLCGVTSVGLSGASTDNDIYLMYEGLVNGRTYNLYAKVSTTSLTSTLAAAASIGATNVKVASVSGLVAGQKITFEEGTANEESTAIVTVGTSGAGGTGLTLYSALTINHGNGSAFKGFTNDTSVTSGVASDTPTGGGGNAVLVFNRTSSTAITGQVYNLHDSTQTTLPVGSFMNRVAGSDSPALTHASGGTVPTYGTGAAMTYLEPGSNKMFEQWSAGAGCDASLVSITYDLQRAIERATTLAAASSIGATNVKVSSVTGLVAGQSVELARGTASAETATILTVGTAGSGGTGITFSSSLTFAHASGSTFTVVGVAGAFSSAEIDPDTSALTGTSFTNTGLTNGVLYFYRVLTTINYFYGVISLTPTGTNLPYLVSNTMSDVVERQYSIVDKDVLGFGTFSQQLIFLNAFSSGGSGGSGLLVTGSGTALVTDKLGHPGKQIKSMNGSSNSCGYKLNMGSSLGGLGISDNVQDHVGRVYILFDNFAATGENIVTLSWTNQTTANANANFAIRIRQDGTVEAGYLATDNFQSPNTCANAFIGRHADGTLGNVISTKKVCAVRWHRIEGYLNLRKPRTLKWMIDGEEQADVVANHFTTTLAYQAFAGDTVIFLSNYAGTDTGRQLYIDTGGVFYPTGSGIEEARVTASNNGYGFQGSTTLAAAASAGATNIKFVSNAGFSNGEYVRIGSGGTLEGRKITAVGTSGAGGTGLTLDAGLTNAHSSGEAVVNVGIGVVIDSPLSNAHAAGAIVVVDLPSTSWTGTSVHYYTGSNVGPALSTQTVYSYGFAVSNDPVDYPIGSGRTYVIKPNAMTGTLNSGGTFEFTNDDGSAINSSSWQRIATSVPPMVDNVQITNAALVDKQYINIATPFIKGNYVEFGFEDLPTLAAGQRIVCVIPWCEFSQGATYPSLGTRAQFYTTTTVDGNPRTELLFSQQLIESSTSGGNPIIHCKPCVGADLIRRMSPPFRGWSQEAIDNLKFRWVSESNGGAASGSFRLFSVIVEVHVTSEDEFSGVGCPQEKWGSI